MVHSDRLRDLAEQLGRDEVAGRFRHALEQLEDRLARLRHSWTPRLEGQARLGAGLEATPPQPSP